MNLLDKDSLTQVLVYVAAVLVTCGAYAQSSNSLESQLLTCSKGATDTVRLACYDGLAESLRAVEVAPEKSVEPSSEAVVTSTAPAEPATPVLPVVDPSTGVPIQNTGGQPVAKQRETFDTGVAQKQSIRVMVEKTKRNARGDWYFYFDNGEVWKQIDSRSRRIPPLPIAATVSRGIFSSYKLHIDGEVWAMKIRRVK